VNRSTKSLHQPDRAQEGPQLIGLVGRHGVMKPAGFVVRYVRAIRWVTWVPAV
jgi:hypothetical protein